MGNNEQGRVVLITGASTGIGLALAQCLLKRPYRLVLTAREGSLGRFAEAGIVENETTMILPLDVSDSEQANRTLELVAQRWSPVEVLVNNAAICYRAVMEHLNDEHEEEQFHVNYLGPLHLIRGVLPAMRARRAGHIINLSSVGGMMAMPTMGGYSSSKFALEGASEALWYELRPWGIRVSLIEPGFVNSDGFTHARFTPRSQSARNDPSDPYHHYYVHLIAFITRMMRASPTTAAGVAKRIVHTMERKHPPLRVAATWDAHFFSLLRRLLPQRIYNYLLYRGLPNIGSWARPPEP